MADMYTMMPIMLLRPGRVQTDGEGQMHDRCNRFATGAIDLCVFLTCRDKEYPSAEDYIIT